MNRLPSLRIFVLVLAALSTSCGGGDSTDVMDTVVSVSVNPATATLGSLGASTQLTASAAGSGGPGSVSGTTFTWSSSNDEVVTVSVNGLATAEANGFATITATAVGTSVSGAAMITVAQVAASVTVTPDVGMLPSGETLQLTATATDAGGSPLAALDLAWSSSDDAIATVDATGLVSGVNAGAVVITAAQDGASGSSALDVIRADLMPTADLTLGGTVTVGEVMIPAGVTVTLSDHLALDAEGPVVIAGDVIGDCLGLSITGQDAVTISGTFSNACGVLPGTEDPPALTITGNAVVSLEGATITSSGNIFISNVLPTPSLTNRSRAARSGLMEPELKLVDTTIGFEPSTAPVGENMSETDPSGEIAGGDGKEGKDIELLFTGLLTVRGGTVIQAQNGGQGGDATVQSGKRTLGVDVARGGDGGNGGNINAGVNTPFGGLFAVDPTAKLLPGEGGRGGDATATGLQDPFGPKAAAASAVGGKGGNGGSVSNQVPGEHADGTGGRGGNATATAATGVDATPSQLAQAGGDAEAQGGQGGNGGQDPNPGDPGPGGEAIAVAGSGGGGEPLGNRDGADGGTASANGGNRGFTNGARGVPGGDADVSGGDGGDGESACLAALQFAFVGSIYVLSDPALSDLFIFAAGLSPGIALAVVFAILERGGDGGDGGMITQLTPGADALLGALAGPGFNGGDAGAGSPVGVPGNPGSIAGGSSINGTFPDVFQPGAAAGSCLGGTSGIVATISPAATGATDRTITLTGNAPWIDVTGTVAEDGTVTASGRGVMNFTPNVLVQFNGMFDEAAGTLDGTYTMDPEKIISAQHPLVYSIEVAVPAQSSAQRSGGNR